jgi:hypothetical protein
MFSHLETQCPQLSSFPRANPMLSLPRILSHVVNSFDTFWAFKKITNIVHLDVHYEQIKYCIGSIVFGECFLVSNTCIVMPYSCFG